MELNFNMYSVSLMAAGCIAGLTAAATILKSGRTVRTFTLMMAGITIWALAYAFELATSSLEDMIFWINIEYVGIALIPAFWLLFCLQFTAYESWLTGGRLALIFLLPATTLLMVWTNDWHHLHYSSTSVAVEGDLFLLNIEAGVWYYVHTVVFYAYLLAGIFFLVKRYRTANRIIKKQLATILAGVAIPWIANVLYLSGFRPFEHLDITPYAFVISGIVILLGLSRFKLFEILPIAREKIIEEMSEGVLILDERFQILDSNPAMRQIFREIDAGVTGKSLLSIYNGDGKKSLHKLLRQKGISTTELTTEIEGEQHYFEVNIKPFLNREGTKKGYFLIFRDITENKQTEAEIIRSREEAEAASKAKSDFLAHMSHEIRTPLNGIIGFVDLLMKTELNPRQNQYLSTVQSSARSLLGIVNDILDLSKIEAGKLELDTEKTDLLELCTQTMDMFAWQARRQKLEMKCHLDADVPRHVMVDGVRLRQVIVNLVGNALKFTEEGEVELRVEVAEPAEGSRVMLRFLIRDTGIGIAEKNQKRIFESFAQEDTSSTRKFSGTGLGLAISNRLLALMESHLQLESEPGKGSTFFFDLPAEAVGDEVIGKQNESLLRDFEEGAPEKEAVEEETAISTDSFKVLVAEDNPVNTLLVRSVIKRSFPGADIIEAGNGKKAVDYFESEEPDLVFMDIQMPEMNGYEATAKMREFEEKQEKKTPIVALTAGTIKGEKEKCLAAGMDDYLSKPVLPESIEKTILKWVKLTPADKKE